MFVLPIIVIAFDLPKNSGHKSSIGCTNQKAWDEQTAGNTSSIRPTGDEEIDEKHNEECG